MALELPKSRLNVRQVQTQKRRVPIEQIMAVQGRSPVATGIETAGNVIGQALTRRAELQRQGQELALKQAQVAKLEALAGQEAGAFAGLDPSTAANFASTSIKQKGDVQEEARKLANNTLKVRALEKQFGYKTGELGDDHPSALLKVQFDNSEKLKNNAAAAEAQERKKQEFLDKQVTKYSGTLEKTGLPNAIAMSENVLSLLPEQGEDVPGYGMFDSLSPDFMAGAAGRQMRQAVSQLFNMELKYRSGAAVVDNELTRLKQEYGQGRMGTEESLRTGVRQYLKRMKELGINTDAGFSQKVRSTYQDQGGRDMQGTLDSLLSLKKIEAPKPKPLPRAGFSPKEEEEYQEWKQKQLGGKK